MNLFIYLIIIIKYENRSLFERFPELERDAIINKNFSQKVKTILRGNISNFLISNISHTSHIVTESVKGCNGYGKEINLDEDFLMENSDTKFYYIDHFYTKSLEEFVQKVKKGSAVHGNRSRPSGNRLLSGKFSGSPRAVRKRGQ